MNIPLPAHIYITQVPDKPNSAKIEIFPLYPGYGVTIGNSLRRVLLSSLSGAGITTVKVEGADHEFATLPHIKEEVLEIILNLKQLNIKLYGNEKEKLNLEVKGKRDVTAADFEKNSNIEIVNSKLHIATLTHKDAQLILEATVERGVGFSTVEEREKEREVGVISIDTFFSPVKAVGYTVDDVRVGKRTDYDKLLMDLETDGSLDVKEALRQASEILVEQFTFVFNETGGKLTAENETDGTPAQKEKKKRIKKSK